MAYQGSWYAIVSSVVRPKDLRIRVEKVEKPCGSVDSSRRAKTCLPPEARQLMKVKMHRK